MTKSQLNAAILKVSEATGKAKEEIAVSLEAKDQWTWFLVRQAA